MTTLNDLTDELAKVKAQQAKALGEIKGKIAELGDKIAQLDADLADQTIPESTQAILNEVIAGAQALDDIVPDAPAPEPAPAPAETSGEIIDPTPAETAGEFTDSTNDA